MITNWGPNGPSVPSQGQDINLTTTHSNNSTTTSVPLGGGPGMVDANAYLRSLIDYEARNRGRQVQQPMAPTYVPTPSYPMAYRDTSMPDESLRPPTRTQPEFKFLGYPERISTAAEDLARAGSLDPSFRSQSDDDNLRAIKNNSYGPEDTPLRQRVVGPNSADDDFSKWWTSLSAEDRKKLLAAKQQAG